MEGIEDDGAGTQRESGQVIVGEWERLKRRI